MSRSRVTSQPSAASTPSPISPAAGQRMFSSDGGRGTPSGQMPSTEKRPKSAPHQSQKASRLR